MPTRPVNLTKQFVIHEVRASAVANAPFRLVLEGNLSREQAQSPLTFDAATCARYQIPMSLDLVGRTLTCVFESRDRPSEGNNVAKEYAARKSLPPDALVIRLLKKTEKVSIGFEKHEEVQRTLELSEEEYEACKALSADSVFVVSFRFA